jgi:hypothetical protein
VDIVRSVHTKGGSAEPPGSLRVNTMMLGGDVVSWGVATLHLFQESPPCIYMFPRVATLHLFQLEQAVLLNMARAENRMTTIDVFLARNFVRHEFRGWRHKSVHNEVTINRNKIDHFLALDRG